MISLEPSGVMYVGLAADRPSCEQELAFLHRAHMQYTRWVGCAIGTANQMQRARLEAHDFRFKISSCRIIL
jgi:hypothetical protein